MKSMCQDVAAELAVGDRLQADRLLQRMTSRIASSSISRSASSSMVAGGVVLAGLRAASGGRSRLPTWSARNGGLVRADMWRLSRGSGMVAARSYIVDNLVDSLDDDA